MSKNTLQAKSSFLHLEKHLQGRDFFTWISPNMDISSSSYLLFPCLFRRRLHYSFEEERKRDQWYPGGGKGNKKEPSSFPFVKCLTKTCIYIHSLPNTTDVLKKPPLMPTIVNVNKRRREITWPDQRSALCVPTCVQCVHERTVLTYAQPMRHRVTLEEATHSYF